MYFDSSVFRLIDNSPLLEVDHPSFGPLPRLDGEILRPSEDNSPPYRRLVSNLCSFSLISLCFVFFVLSA